MAMSKENYYKKNQKLIEKVKTILEKETLNGEELKDYVKNNLEMPVSVFKYRIEAIFAHDCLTENEYMRLKNICQKIEARQIEQNLKSKMSKKYYQEKYKDMINTMKILATKENLTEEELYNYIKNNTSYSLAALKNRIMSLLKYDCLTIEEINSLVNIYTKLKKYTPKKPNPVNTSNQNNKKTSEVITNAIILVEEFIESGMTLQSFCKSNYTTPGEFNIKLKLLGRAQSKLYDSYVAYSAQQNECIMENINTNAHDIINKIVNGVSINDTEKRDYDIIDFYQTINIPLDEYYQLVKSSGIYNIEEIKIFGKFFNKNSDEVLSDQEIKQFLDNYFELKGHVLDEADKIAIISYLKANNIPITLRSKRVASNKYISNTLFEQNNDKQLVKQSNGGK